VTYQNAQSADAVGVTTTVTVVVGVIVSVLVTTIVCVHPPIKEHATSEPSAHVHTSQLDVTLVIEIPKAETVRDGAEPAVIVGTVGHRSIGYVVPETTVPAAARALA